MEIKEWALFIMGLFICREIAWADLYDNKKKKNIDFENGANIESMQRNNYDSLMTYQPKGKGRGRSDLFFIKSNFYPENKLLMKQLRIQE